MQTPYDQEIHQFAERLGSIEPTAESTRRAIKRTREALLNCPVKTPSRDTRKLMFGRIAACVCVAVGGISLAFVARGTGNNDLLADVQKALKKVRSVRFKMTRSVEGESGSTTARVMFFGSHLGRAELPNGEIMIMDRQQNKMMRLIPKQKKAVIMQGGRGTPIPDFLHELLTLHKRKVKKELAKRKIDGVKAVGFVVDDNGTELTVWVDSKTHLPVRFESTARIPADPGNPVIVDVPTKTKVVHEITSDFVFNQKLDETLFRLTPPEGYSVETKEVTFDRDERKRRIDEQRRANQAQIKRAKEFEKAR